MWSHLKMVASNMACSWLPALIDCVNLLSEPFCPIFPLKCSNLVATKQGPLAASYKESVVTRSISACDCSMSCPVADLSFFFVGCSLMNVHASWCASIIAVVPVPSSLCYGHTIYSAWGRFHFLNLWVFALQPSWYVQVCHSSNTWPSLLTIIWSVSRFSNR